MRRILTAAAAAAALSMGADSALAQYSDGVIKLGVMNDQSGTYSDLSGQGSVWAAKKAIEDFCKANKCHDKIEVVFADHQNKPDVGSNIVRQWFDVDQVDAVVDEVSHRRVVVRQEDQMVQDARGFVGVPVGVDVRAVLEQEVRYVEVAVNDRKSERYVQHLLRCGRTPVEVSTRLRVLGGIVIVQVAQRGRAGFIEPLFHSR